MKTFEELADKAIKNIESDRKTTAVLLNDLQKQLASGQFTHIEAGTIAAKLVETLQRSNEQLVKLASVVSRQKLAKSPLKFDAEERQNLFDIIEDKSNGE